MLHKQECSYTEYQHTVAGITYETKPCQSSVLLYSFLCDIAYSYDVFLFVYLNQVFLEGKSVI